MGNGGDDLAAPEKLLSSDAIVDMIHAVSALVATFELEAEAAKLLKQAGRRAAMFYHYDARFDELPGPLGDLTDLLKSAANAATRLEAALLKLPTVIEPPLARRRIWDAGYSEDHDLSLDHLGKDLRQFAANARDIIPLIPRRGAGNPGERKVGRIIRQLLPRVEEAFGERVGTSRSVASVPTDNLRGLGGEFVRRLFKIIDSRVRQSTLVRKVSEARELMNNPTPEYLEEMALFAD